MFQKFLKTFAILLIYLILNTLHVRIVSARVITVDVSPPDSVNCANRPYATFSATELNPLNTYSFEITNLNSNKTYVLYRDITNKSQHVYTQYFDINDNCYTGGMTPYPVVEEGMYSGLLKWKDPLGNESSSTMYSTDKDGKRYNYFYIIQNVCDISNTSHVVAGQQGQLYLTGRPNSIYGIQIFPTNSCSYNNEAQTDGSGKATIPVNCDLSVLGSHQISVILVDPPNETDLCWKVFNVVEYLVCTNYCCGQGSVESVCVDHTYLGAEYDTYCGINNHCCNVCLPGKFVTPAPPNGASCTGTSGVQGLCYNPSSSSCRPPSRYDGQGGCTAGQECCVPSDLERMDCTGVSTGSPGECYFLNCPADLSWDGITPPFFSLCPSLHSCCVEPNNFFTNKPPLTVNCTINGQQGISTAVGCIAVTNPTEFLKFILPWALGVGSGTAFILIVVSGFLLMTSAGDPQRARAAKELLTAAIIGLLLIIFSVYLLDFIGLRIFKLPGL